MENNHKLVFDLMSGDPETKRKAILYMVYRTVAINNRVALRVLRKLLCNEFFIEEEVVNGAVASLSSRSGLNGICRYLPKGKPVDETVFHLPKEVNSEFASWLNAVELANPSYKNFLAPVYVHKDGGRKVA